MKKRRISIWKAACEYLRRTKDFGTFFALLFLWKHRKKMPIVVEETKVRGFIYPH